MRRGWAVAVAALVPLAAACTSSPTPASGGSSPQIGPSAHGAALRAQHAVVVVLENHSYADVIDSPQAPYLNSLASRGKSLTDMHAITHPSQPNYLALFSGSTHGIVDDACPQRLSGPNLGSELLAARRSFVGYSEDLPGAGSTACAAGSYARKHAPWTNFPNLPARVGQPFSSFPNDYARLPTLSFVVPNLDDDMHDGSIEQGDAWVRAHLDGYARWAVRHHSLLVVTWDEDDGGQDNQIPTVIVGAGVTPGRISTRLTLYSLLRTLEDAFGLPRLGASARAPAIPLG